MLTVRGLIRDLKDFSRNQPVLDKFKQKVVMLSSAWQQSKAQEAKCCTPDVATGLAARCPPVEQDRRTGTQALRAPPCVCRHRGMEPSMQPTP